MACGGSEDSRAQDCVNSSCSRRKILLHLLQFHQMARCVCARVYVCMRMCVCMCTYVCARVCVCVCLCITCVCMLYVRVHVSVPQYINCNFLDTIGWQRNLVNEHEFPAKLCNVCVSFHSLDSNKLTYIHTYMHVHMHTHAHTHTHA